MRMADAKALLVAHGGYRVHFDKRGDGLLCTDYFPERDEPPIADVNDAWELAAEFAKIDPEVFVNVYVIQAHDWCPVPEYRGRKLNVYPRVKEGAE